MIKKISELDIECRKQIQGVKDFQELLSGKWTTVIIAALYHSNKLRFMELCKHIDHISPKVLSKELKDLEINQLVKRTVVETSPIHVEYELTEHGKSLNNVIEAMGNWAITYREGVLLK